MRYVKHLAHVVYAVTALHASILISDRMKDAYADVALDKVANLAMRAIHIGENAQ
jgi:hypothetical protein